MSLGKSSFSTKSVFFRQNILFVIMIAFAGLMFVNTEAYAADNIPEALQDWQEWVLANQEAREFCPAIPTGQAQVNICNWAGSLSIDIANTGANFSQSWNILAESWIPLPGDSSQWPRSVTSNGKAIQVIAKNIDGRTRPALLLDKGRYQIRGEFQWSQQPNQLAIPTRSSVIDLTLNNQKIQETFTDDGALWLGERQEKEKDNLFANVYRKFSDGQPMTMDVIIELSAAGQTREVILNNLLLNGFELMHVESDLPFKQTADGNINLQIQAGEWEFALKARSLTQVSAIEMAPLHINNVDQAENINSIVLVAETEIWSYQDAPSIRNTQAKGLNPIDPQQSNVPTEWEELPSFIARSGGVLQIEEKRRGVSKLPNTLTLNRDLWLDFGNQSFTFSDNLSGRMQDGWRLDLKQPFNLQSATANGEQSLITESKTLVKKVNELANEASNEKIADERAYGIEVRQHSVNVNATGQIDKAGHLPISGWNNAMQSVNTTLHLPPGYRLLAAPGSDKARGTWFDQWELWDIFFLLFVSVAFAKVVNPKWGILAFLMLLLTYHELNAPKWLWLNLALALTIVNISSKAKYNHWAKLYQNASVALLALVAIPFFGQQAKSFIYPQLERIGYSHYAVETHINYDSIRTEKSPSSFNDLTNEAQEIVVTGSRINKSKQQSLDRYDTNALIQTGPGLPSWNWRSYQLSWSGPVSSSQEFNPIILGPWLTRLWLLSSVVLIFILLARLAKQTYQEIRQSEWFDHANTDSKNETGFIRLGFLIVLISVSSSWLSVQADYPSQDMLEQLKERLLEPASCSPHCSDLHKANLNIKDNNLRLELEYHLLDQTPVVLPGRRGQWTLDSIRDANGNSLTSYSTDRTYVLLDKGIQTISLVSELNLKDALQIQFSQRPRHIEVNSEGWDVSGVRENIMLSDSLQLLRKSEDTDSFGDNATRVKPFVLVEREFLFGLDWLVETRVKRIAPEYDNIQIRIPLLANESVLTDGIEVDNQNVIVSLNTNAQIYSWTSKLPLSSQLELTAPPASNEQWQEQWGITVSHLWNIQASGTPEINRPNTSGDRHQVYLPRAGESLLLDISRPEAKDGATLAIDSVQHTTTIGKRLSNHAVQFNYRSSQGGQHIVVLPEAAQLQSVSIDGRQNFLQTEGRNLALNILPGNHQVDIQWTEERDISHSHTNSLFDLQHPASNINSRMKLPNDRWLLFVSNERLGPAILYWPRLFVLLLLALALGKFAKTPLHWYDWVFLGLGFSTISWFSYLVFAAWILALAYRNVGSDNPSRGLYNFSQLSLAGLTAAAAFALIYSLPTGLLGKPRMSVTGYQSSAYQLNWYHDKTIDILPEVSAFSVPLWIYKFIILIWALWLSFALMKWIPWAWQQFSADGVWHKKSKPPAKPSSKPID